MNYDVMADMIDVFEKIERNVKIIVFLLILHTILLLLQFTGKNTPQLEAAQEKIVSVDIVKFGGQYLVYGYGLPVKEVQK